MRKNTLSQYLVRGNRYCIIILLGLPLVGTYDNTCSLKFVLIAIAGLVSALTASPKEVHETEHVLLPAVVWILQYSTLVPKMKACSIPSLFTRPGELGVATRIALVLPIMSRSIRIATYNLIRMKINSSFRFSSFIVSKYLTLITIRG